MNWTVAFFYWGMVIAGLAICAAITVLTLALGWWFLVASLTACAVAVGLFLGLATKSKNECRAWI